MGKILRVDLSKEEIKEERIGAGIARKFMGGYGTGGHMLYKEVPPGTGAFDPKNLLIFSTGPITGTLAPAASRYAVVAKSPLTGYFGDANSGGFFGPMIKFAGYDMIIISGAAKKPEYILIDESEIRIIDASHLWGKSARETDQIVREDHGKNKLIVATIGQAGENLVRFACIANDNAERFAGRCGLGSVMGSKKLKAIAVKGEKKVPVVDEDKLREFTKEFLSRRNESELAQNFSKYGTPGDFSTVYELGDIPIHNWTKGTLNGHENLSMPGGYEKVLVGRRACYNCPVGCRRVVKVSTGPFKTDGEIEGPEYETLAAFGANCEIVDVEAVVKLNDLCNVLGLDTISTGSVIAFAMECYERGLITKKDIDGLELAFGNVEAALEIAKKIAHRNGIGDILAEGVKRASKVIGGEKFAMHVKGTEIAMHNPVAALGAGIHYATSPTGGRHTEGLTSFWEWFGGPPELKITSMDRFSTESKAEISVKRQNYVAALNAMGFCQFIEIGWATINDLLTIHEFVTGASLSVEEFMKIGERIFNLKRAFNIRHGSSVEEDTLPPRLLHEPLKDGGSANIVVKLDEMLPEYYKLRGWDPQKGVPTEKKLAELQLDFVKI
jgi:aldehyde:ferredoxin oxidoreductase